MAEKSVEEKTDYKIDPIPERVLKEAEISINSPYKAVVLTEFKGEKDVEVRVYKLTTENDSRATDHYTKTYNRLMKDPDMMPKIQLKKILKEKGVLGTDQQNEIENVKEELENIQYFVAKMRYKGRFDKKTLEDNRKKWFEKRDKLIELTSLESEVLSHSIEGRAEEEEYKHKLFSSVKYSDETPVWPTLDDLNKETDKASVTKILNSAIYFWAGLTPEIVYDLPAKLLFGGEEISKKTSKKPKSTAKADADNG